MADIYGMVGAGLNIGGGILTNYLNRNWAAEQAAEDRRENYKYAEMLAENADYRTRALYNDLYSPEAQKKQIETAGLSPSIFFGGTPGTGGVAGAQGTMAGVQTQYQPLNMLEMAQATNLFEQTKKTKAETEKTKAETKSINEDVSLKKLEVEIQTFAKSQYEDEWRILNSKWETPEGEQTSLFEMANNHYTFESFLNDVRKDEKGNTNFKVSTEAEIQKLRNIYESASRFRRDIITLSEETVSAEFQLSITSALNKAGFAEQNAETAIQQLKASAAVSELTESQKEAWNDLLDRLGKKGSTTRDIITVIGLILGNFASHTGIKVQI